MALLKFQKGRARATGRRRTLAVRKRLSNGIYSRAVPGVELGG